MTLAEICSNEELRRSEFPVVRDSVFLAHAGVAPLPERVAQAVRTYALQCTLGDQESVGPIHQLQRTRELVAQLLKATPEEISLVGPTSLALSFIAAGLKFKRGGNVIVYQDDYPSNVYPWMALADRGVEVRFLNIRELGCIRPMDVIGQVDEQTRLVALASCHFISGFRIDLNSIGRELHQRNILFCVDAIQTVGAFPTTVEHIDFLAADSHKWMLGPCAAGILFVRKELREQIHPTAIGWSNVRCPDFVAQDELVYRTNGRRFEAGTLNLLGLAGLHAALELLLEVGVDPIARELVRKRAWLVPALEAKGYTVLQRESPPESHSGIVSFFREGVAMDVLHNALAAAGIITSLRSDRSGRKYIRLSPHFYNTDAELHRCLEML